MKKRIIRVISLVMLLVLFATSNFGFIINANAATYTYSNLKDLPQAALDRFLYLLDTNKTIYLSKYNGTYCVCFKYYNNTYYIKESAFLPAGNKSSDSLAFHKAASPLTFSIRNNLTTDDSTYLISRYKVATESRLDIMRLDHTIKYSNNKITIKGVATIALSATYDLDTHRIKVTSGEYTDSNMHVFPTYTVSSKSSSNLGFITMYASGKGIRDTSKAPALKDIVSVAYKVGSTLVKGSLGGIVGLLVEGAVTSYNYIKADNGKTSFTYNLTNAEGQDLRVNKYQPVYTVTSKAPISLRFKNDNYTVVLYTNNKITSGNRRNLSASVSVYAKMFGGNKTCS